MLVAALLVVRGAGASAPPLPEDGVRDDARILGDALRQELVKELQALHEATGLQVLVDTTTFLPPDIAPAQWIRTLRDGWLAGKPGVIVSLTRRTEGPPLVDASPSLWPLLGDPHVYAIMQRATKAGASGQNLEAKLTASVRSLITDLHSADQRRRQHSAWLLSEERWLAGGLAALLAVAALLTWLMVRRSRRLAAERAAVKLLPDVIMHTRLGAPGGASVVEHSYRK